MFKTPENLLFLLLGGVWLMLLVKSSVARLHERRRQFVSGPLFDRITGHKPTRRPLAKWGLMIAAFALLALSLARPTGGFYEETVSGSGLDLVVLFDISQSMQAMDIERNSRLEVGKALVEHLTNGLRQDRVALVVFAGDTMVQCPLTQDKNAFLTFLQRLDSSLLNKQGTNLAGAIETGIDRFDRLASQTRVMVLVSDGEDQNKDRLEKALKEAKRKDILIFTVGLGSREGAPIPVSQDVWGRIAYKVHQGRQVVSKLDDSTLKHIAKTTGARYFRASDGQSATEVAKALSGLKRVAMASGTRLTARELFSWPGLLAFLVLLVEWMISERIPYEREKDHWLKRI